jgi:isopentenyl-diphosphate delta-isomerase
LAEELGLPPQIPVYRDTVEYRANVGNGMVEHEVVEIFVVQADAITIRPNTDEVMDYRWETLQSLAGQIAARPQDFTPWLKIYIEKHATKIFGDQAG